MKSSNRILSIILPTYNSENTIEKCLKSLIDQDFEDYEIIVVDDGSTDNTLRIIRNIVKHRDNITVLRLDHGERVNAKIRGLKAASGRYVYIAESDAYYSKDCMRECYKIAVKGKHIVSPTRRVWGLENSVAQRCYDFYVNAREYSGFPGSERLKGGWFYPRALLLKIYNTKKFSIFDDIEVGEEARKLGYTLKLSKGKWWHREPASLNELFQRNLFYGKNSWNYYRTHPKLFIRFIASLILNIGLIVSLLIGLTIWSYALILFFLLLAIFLYRNRIFIIFGIKKKRFLDLLLFLTLYKYAGLLGSAVGLIMGQIQRKGEGR
jgi:glycosyltransferase involved in cell wall biosynthesis